MFTQADVQAIAKKLGCVPREGKAHKYYDLFIDDKLITSIGERRASKEKDHGHVSHQLHITQKECRDLSACPLSRDDYLGLLKERGFLPT
jgi:hypothetical protein